MINERKYPLAERFKAPQGEGLYTGTPMAFIRFVGCSVGKTICEACDTNFNQMYAHVGGGLYTAADLVDWVGDYEHICITGGEPLDRDLYTLLYDFMLEHEKMIHIETSGTKSPSWFENLCGETPTEKLWICVSPKPGYLDVMIEAADEVKVILGGLGDGPGWPTVAHAIAWAQQGKLVYLQPRQGKLYPNDDAMREVLSTVSKHPELRVSAQLHKYIHTK